MAVVKAVAYGSDAIAVTQCLEKEGVDYFAVAFVSEGIILRNAGIKTPILVLHPQISQLELAFENRLEPAIYSKRLLEAVFKLTPLDEPFPIHVKINTGLNRLGFNPDEIPNLLAQISKAPLNIKSVFSHLAATEDLKERAFMQKQIQTFDTLQKLFPKTAFRHLLNSSGILNYPEAQYDMVRSGIGLYGYGNDPKIDQQLKPVVCVKTLISQIHQLKTGDSVGYNKGFVATTHTRVATLPIGHADGLSRRYGKGVGTVWIKGQQAPILGNVCMDMVMVDVTEIQCEEGDEVVVFGESPAKGAQQFAKQASTISYEILTALAARIKRVVIDC